MKPPSYLALSLLIFAVIGVAYGEDDYCHFEGVCNNQQFYYETVVKDYNECLIACKKDFDCNYFSYVEAYTYNCQFYFQDYCAEDTYYCDNKPCFSGKSTCHLFDSPEPELPELGCGIEGACDGTLLSEETFDSESECVDLCGGTDGCYWSTYEPATGNCRLLQTCSSFDSAVNITSNYKKCAAGNEGVLETPTDCCI